MAPVELDGTVQYIDRDLIEHYATNMFELKKLGSVWTHKGPDGKLDGFRVGLARCSVLRQGGRIGKMNPFLPHRRT